MRICWAWTWTVTLASISRSPRFQVACIVSAASGGKADKFCARVEFWWKKYKQSAANVEQYLQRFVRDNTCDYDANGVCVPRHGIQLNRDTTGVNDEFEGIQLWTVYLTVGHITAHNFIGKPVADPRRLRVSINDVELVVIPKTGEGSHLPKESIFYNEDGDFKLPKRVRVPTLVSQPVVASGVLNFDAVTDVDVLHAEIRRLQAVVQARAVEDEEEADEDDADMLEGDDDDIDMAPVRRSKRRRRD